MSKQARVLASKSTNRRGILALVGAGGAAAVAALFSRRNGAEAHGIEHRDSYDADPAFHGQNHDTGYGVQGDALSAAGVHAASDSGPGLLGYSNTGDGLRSKRVSSSGAGAGVQGFSGVSETDAPNRVGVRGVGLDDGVRGEGIGSSGIGVRGEGVATGVRGSASVGAGVRGDGKTGVRGVGAGSSCIGVRGEGGAKTTTFKARIGLQGAGTHGGVVGESSGDGVVGLGAYSGVTAVGGSFGVLALNAPTRPALRTAGRVRMDCARKKSLSNRSNLITLPSGVNAGSVAIVLATMQSDPGNDAFIRRAHRVDNRHIRIVFNKKPARSTAVGYWVVHVG